MKYNRYVFTVTTWPDTSEPLVETTVVVQLTSGMTEALLVALEDWDVAAQGEVRGIQVKGIATIDRGEQSDGDQRG